MADPSKNTAAHAPTSLRQKPSEASAVGTKLQHPSSPAQVTDDSPNNEDEDPRAKMLYAHMFMNIFGICVLLQARPMLILDALGKDRIGLTRLMGKASAAVGLLELFINPIAGQMTDKYGRRPLLLLSPMVNAVNKFLVAYNPSLFNIVWERIVDGAVTTLAGSTTTCAALSDLYSGKALGLSFAKLGSAAGIGALMGSFVSGRLLAAGVKPTMIFRGAALFASLQWCIDAALLHETLPKLERSTKPLSPPNPLKALKLLEGSRGLKTLVAVAVLQCMPEGKNISDLLVAYQMNHVGFSPVERANYTTLFGSSMMVGGSLAKFTMNTFGQRGHTTLSNCLTILSMLINGSSARPFMTWLALLVLFPTMERRCATSAMATDLAISEGWAKGEYSAAFANVRALTVITAPLLYSNAYSVLAPQGRAGYTFGIVAAIVAVAEMLHRSLSDEDCGIVKMKTKKEDKNNVEFSGPKKDDTKKVV